MADAETNHQAMLDDIERVRVQLEGTRDAYQAECRLAQAEGREPDPWLKLQYRSAAIEYDRLRSYVRELEAALGAFAEGDPYSWGRPTGQGRRGGEIVLVADNDGSVPDEAPSAGEEG